MGSLEKLHKEIEEIKKTIPNTIADDFCKLAEEVGELSQSINKTIGIKKHNLTPDEIRLEVLEETADVLQNLLSIASSYNISTSEILEALEGKNEKWKNYKNGK